MENEKTKLNIIIVIGICLLVIIIGIIIGVFLIKNKKDDFPTTSIDVTPKEKIKLLNNYIFYLPDELLYSNGLDYIYASNNTTTMTFKMNIVVSNYTSLKDKINNITKEFTDSGIQVLNYDITNYNNHEFLVFALKYNNHEFLLAMSELDDAHIIQLEINSTTENGYNEALKYAVELLENYDLLNAYIGEHEEEITTNSENNLSDLFKNQVEGE